MGPPPVHVGQPFYDWGFYFGRFQNATMVGYDSRKRIERFLLAVTLAERVMEQRVGLSAGEVRCCRSGTVPTATDGPVSQ